MRATILVLEDDPVLQELLQEVLQDEGHAVTVVATLTELVERMPPTVDLLISDILVDMRPIGLEAIDIVRQTLGQPIPTILCSGAANHIETHRERIDQFGATVIHKPFSIDHLIAAVDEALDGRDI